MSLSARCELLDTRQIPENESATAGSGLTLTCNRPLRVQTSDIGEEGEVEDGEQGVLAGWAATVHQDDTCDV